MSIKTKLKVLAAAAGLAVAGISLTGAAVAAPLPAGWSSIGSAGQFTAQDGVVTLAPGFDAYQWISTNGSPTGVGRLPTGPTGQETNGATMRTPTFSVNVDDALDFYFNYITSDGVQFTEYAWAALFDGGGVFQQYLFTARTTASGNTVPGFGLPGLGAGVTLNPASTAIIPGGPAFSPLGGSSGACFGGIGQGCGYTGWIEMDYTFTTGGNYYIGFGVTNALDTAFQTAFAVAGVAVNDVPIDVPEPASLALVGLALAGLAATRRRRA